MDAEGIPAEISGGQDLSADENDEVELGDEEFDVILQAESTHGTNTLGSTKQATWHQQLNGVNAFSHERRNAPVQLAAETKKRREVWYVINVGSSLAKGHLIVEFHAAETKKNGDFGKIKRLAVKREKLSTLTDQRDRDLLSLLFSNSLGSDSYSYASRASDWDSFSHCTPSASNLRSATAADGSHRAPGLGAGYGLTDRKSKNRGLGRRTGVAISTRRNRERRAQDVGTAWQLEAQRRSEAFGGVRAGDGRRLRLVRRKCREVRRTRIVAVDQGFPEESLDRSPVRRSRELLALAVAFAPHT